MDNLTKKAETDNLIMRELKVNEIRHVVCTTDKGPLSLMLRKGGSEHDYRFVLDAVPVDDNENKKLMQLFNGVLFTL